jgi:hypothetical protein
MGVLPQTLNLDDGIALGFFTTIIIATIVDKFGDAMFRRGVAKPFYILGHRLHHRHFLMIILPLLYSALAALIMVGYVKIVGSLLWTGLASTLVVAVGCVVTDLVLDYRSSTAKTLGFIRHELIYLLIPAYAFAEFLRLAL